MINSDDITRENIKKDNTSWPQVPDHANRLLMTGGSRYGKTNALINLIKIQDDDNYNIIDEIRLYVKDPNEAKYQYLIKSSENMGLEHCKNPKALIDYSNDTENIYENIEECNPNKERKILAVFDDATADMVSN